MVIAFQNIEGNNKKKHRFCIECCSTNDSNPVKRRVIYCWWGQKYIYTEAHCKVKITDHWRKSTQSFWLLSIGYFWVLSIVSA